jgi:hypothetical protein
MNMHWYVRLLRMAAVLAAAGIMCFVAPGGCSSGPPEGTAGQDSAGTKSAASGAPSAVHVDDAARFLKANQLEGRVVLMQFASAGDPLGDMALDMMADLQHDKAVPEISYMRIEESHDAKAADAYYTTKPLGLPVYKDADGALAAYFGVAAMPSVVVLDRFGHVRYRGPLPEGEKLLDWKEMLMREQADPGSAAPSVGVSMAAAQNLLGETKLPDLAGAVKPLGDYRGRRGLMALFVDTTCPFSGTAINELPQVAATLGKQGMATVLVNLADREDAVRKFYTARNVGAPVVFDTTKATQRAWQVTMVPTVCVFDADGSLLYRGNAVWKNLASAAEGALMLPAGSIKFGPAGTQYG